jgi:CxxC motif-containing protein (DUF1111 family)/predicted lipoprotein with Yx(FWY)xxD motif
MHKIIGSTLAAAIALTLTACIDDKDYVADVPAPTIPSELAVSGSGIKGTLVSALVEVFDSANLSVVLASTQTDANGEYTITLTDATRAAITGTFVVRLSADDDTTMICDASACGDLVRGDVVPASELAGLKLSTISYADGSGTISAKINALTTLATDTLLAVAASNPSLDISDPATLTELQEDASRVIGATLGVDLSETNIFDVAIVDASVSANVSTTDSVAATLSLINAALSGLDTETGETLSSAFEAYIMAVAVVTTAIVADPAAELSAETLAAMAAINIIQAEISQEVTDLSTDIGMDTGVPVVVVDVPTEIDPGDIAGAADEDDDITGGTGGTGGTPDVNNEVSFANERLVGGSDSLTPGYTLYVFDNDLGAPGSSVCNGGCASAWPPVLVEDEQASGVSGLSTIERDDGSKQAAYNNRPLYFFAGDSAVGDTSGDGIGGIWWLVPYGVLGEVDVLYNELTAQQPDTQFETDVALVTRFSDRPRTRHAREDEFQSYDHYIKFYFEDRSSNIEIVDYVAKGGNTIEMNVRTIFPLSTSQAENRWWYEGITTVAQYASNGIMTYKGFDGTYYNYQKTSNENTRLRRPIQLGDRMEFEISQFSAPGIPRGQANYYGTTFLYIVGEGIVPWYAEAAGSRYPEDSQKIPEEFWLGGHTTIHHQYTDEPNDNFLQMATNLGYDNGQKFLLGRRVHHSSVINGSHDEDPDNGVLASNAGLSGTRYINQRCTGCHERNGGAGVANNGASLDRWVFKVGDANGAPDPLIGSVLQPSGSAGEGNVSIASWTQRTDGLRTPNYQFSQGTPATFSARIAPRLVGLGLLEAIPETAILALEDPDDANGDGISGRANKVIDPENSALTRLGRFGWKAATTSVKHQVAAALNTDMGVRTSVLPNPDCGSAQTNCGGNSPLMPEENLDNLILYISALGVRPQRVWNEGVENQQVLQGREQFRDIGCAGCHTESFQTSEFHPLAEVRDQTIHPYSDMLLHYMGEELADNLGEGLASGGEWRTTPLWGLGLSACVTGGVINPTGREGGEICTPDHAYLHDGRARSIEEAILWHGIEGSEGKRSTDAYKALSVQNQQSVLRFLESL